MGWLMPNGDAGAFSKNSSLFVLSWNGLVGIGSTQQTRMVMTVFTKADLCPDGSTMNAIWEVLAWCFNTLALGIWPVADHTGAPFQELSSTSLSVYTLEIVSIKNRYSLYFTVRIYFCKNRYS